MQWGSGHSVSCREDQRMRILLSGYLLTPAAGGGCISALTLLRILAQRHEVTVLGAAFDPSGAPDLAHRVNFRQWKEPYLCRRRSLPHGLRLLLQDVLTGRAMDKACRELHPDLVIMESQPMIRRPGDSRAKIIFFVRLFHFGPYRWYPSHRSRVLNGPFDALRALRNRGILRAADLVLANSQFTAQALHAVGIPAEVVYPLIDLGLYRVAGNSRECLLFVNPAYKKKGVEVIPRIAERLPDHKLLVVGNTNPSLKGKVQGHTNILWRGWCNDMREVYGKARIVLMPSLVEETFGRVPVEAGVNGIPTIASHRGGLPESVGEGGILVEDPSDPLEWIRAIETLEDPRMYRELSERAVQNAQRFAVERTFQSLKALADGRLALPESL